MKRNLIILTSLLALTVQLKACYFVLILIEPVLRPLP